MPEDAKNSSEDLESIMKEIKEKGIVPAGGAPGGGTPQAEDEKRPLENLKQVLSEADAEAAHKSQALQPSPNSIAPQEKEPSVAPEETTPQETKPPQKQTIPLPSSGGGYFDSESISKLDAIIARYKPGK